METRTRLYAAAAGTAALFLLVQLGALALVDPFVGAGFRAVEDPSDPTNTLVYLLAILVMTAVVLAAVRLGIDRVLRVFVTLVAALLASYLFSVVVPPAFRPIGPWVLAGALAVFLYVYPEWYVIDAAGVLIGAAGAGLFGISFGPLPAILLLTVLAVYDAISVYRTEHMLDLAEGVTDLKLPLVLVVPLTLSYSFRDAADAVSTDGERDAFYIGLGDVVMPTIMVASAATFLSAPSLGVPGLALNRPALAAMLGTFVGLAGLLWLVAKGRAHAGLPLLNGGAIAGYLLGAAASGIPIAEAVGIAGSL